MITHTDIKNRISEKFGSNSFEVFKLIEEKSKEFDYLNNPRIVRCILFLSDNNFEKLKEYIDAAINDPRDVMFWAEYENIDDINNTKRVRDFNKTFDESTI